MQVNSAIFHLNLPSVKESSQTHFNSAESAAAGGQLDDFHSIGGTNFARLNIGYAAAIAVVFTLITMVLSMLNLRFLERRD